MIDPLEARLAALRVAATAIRSIGLEDPAIAAESVARRVDQRAGFGGTAYVMALAGGTGVGKSSLLNALAGHTVSAVRAIRPTTDEPLAWLADGVRHQAAPLLDWLGVRHAVGHADAELASVVILDLPDVDSVRGEHRATVDEILPRIDAVTWVADPEKYDDQRLHTYLRSLAGHADRMRFVLNKADRLTAEQGAALAADWARRLAEDGIPDARVHVVSSTTLAGIPELRSTIARAADAKADLAAKAHADVRDAVLDLAAAAGVRPDAPREPLIPPQRLALAIDAATSGALAVVDPAGVARQVRAAVLAGVRHRGGSLLGRALALLAWMTGQQRRSADPRAYLLDWRRRGSLGRVVNPLRALLVEAAAGLPADSRPAILGTLGADAPEAMVSRTLDASAAQAAAGLRIPGSWIWPVVGAVQLVIGAVFLFAAAWYLTLFVGGGQVPVGAFDLPVVGPVPVPLALLVGSVAGSGLLGWLTGLHAGLIGRRVGRRVAQRVEAAVRTSIEEVGLEDLRRVEAARMHVADALDLLER
ncbi:MAG: GTPase [Chloroflexota bacterium]